ncbi:hypothetical protein BGZ98_004490 [Dissophora globulifera]|nr:hypothetical protein BGZ98_004490 [Dissophora globulifera]
MRSKKTLLTSSKPVSRHPQPQSQSPQHIRGPSDSPLQIDPVSTTASMPSSDDERDETSSNGGNDLSDSDDQGTNAISNSIEKMTFAKGEHLEESASPLPLTATTSAAVTAVPVAEAAAQHETNNNAPIAAAAQDAITATPTLTSIDNTLNTSTSTTSVIDNSDDDIKKEDLRVRSTGTREEQLQEEAEPRKSFTRPLSRQDLRRKSSFFNSKDIAISDQRFSSSTSASLRPIADPRFKSRFQSVLSQWQARSGGN